MSPRTPQQLDKIRKERRKAIMDTSLEVFSEYGYESASISMIAKKVGISKGLMYNYFESKEELLIDALQYYRLDKKAFPKLYEKQVRYE